MGLFSAQTGTALATELLYRLLWDLVNRLLASLHRFAVSRLDRLSDYLQQRAEAKQRERVELQERDKQAAPSAQRSALVRELEAADEPVGFLCPMGGRWKDRPPGRGPPPWAERALQAFCQRREQRWARFREARLQALQDMEP